MRKKIISGKIFPLKVTFLTFIIFERLFDQVAKKVTNFYSRRFAALPVSRNFLFFQELLNLTSTYSV